MKIAICFAGRVKTYEDSISWFKHMINDPRIDFFCSINDLLDDYHKQFLIDFKIKKYHFENYQLPYHESIFSHNKRHETNVYNTHSMYYNRKKCFELVEQYQQENRFVYDVVVFFRADIVTQNSFDLIVPTDNMTIYIPSGYDWGGLNDQIAHGTFSAMKIYADLYNHISKYCLEQGCLFHPETLLKWHLDKNQLKIRRFNFLYTLNSKRTIQKI
jgi:hypothetical protein